MNIKEATAVGPFVGREQELGILRDLTDAVKSGLGHAVVLIGEAGIGKTRLIQQWKSHSEANGNWIEARARLDAQNRAYFLLRKLASSAMGITIEDDQADSPVAALDLLADRIDDVHEAANSADLHANLSHFLSLEIAADSQKQERFRDPKARQAQYTEAVAGLLRALARDKPIIVVLEDLQWSDPSSVEVISQLILLAREAPILFCMSARVDRGSAGWRLIRNAGETLGGLAKEINLHALSVEASRELIAQLPPSRKSDEFADVILERAEGNPLFIEEITRMLLEKGVLVKPQVEDADLRIPETLQALLDERINLLPEDTRGLLQCASVLGREFSVSVLQGMATIDASPADLRTQLSEIESADLISLVRVQPELIYRFRHTLLYEAVYSSLTQEQQSRLNLAAGEALESLAVSSEADLWDLSVRLARHFGRAGDRKRALKYRRKAGQAALATYANVEAESHLRRALDLVETSAEKAEVLGHLGRALARQSQFEEALSIWKEAIDLFKQLGQLDQAAEFYARSARVAWNSDDVPGSLSICQEGMIATQSAEPGRGRARLLHESARAKFFNAEVQGVRELLEDALAMAEQISAPLVLAEAYSTMGLLQDISAEEAIGYQELSKRLSQEAGLLNQAARAESNLGHLLWEKAGDSRRAREHFLEAANIERKRGNLSGELIDLASASRHAVFQGELSKAEAEFAKFDELQNRIQNLGPALFVHQISQSLVLRMQGQKQKALSILEQAFAQTQERGDVQNQIFIGNFIAELQLDAGSMQSERLDVEEFNLEELLGEAIDLAVSGIAYSSSWPRSLLAMHHVRHERIAQAKALLNDAKQQSARNPFAIDAAWIAWASARLAATQSDWPTAFEQYEATSGEFAKLEMLWWWAGVLREWADAHLQRGEAGDYERAQRLLREVHQIIQGMGLEEQANDLEGQLRQVRSQVLEESHALEQASKELADAGRIQADFLPARLPNLPGWQIAARLIPAKQASGDYYDFIDLPDNRLGIVIADVADKGAGAALYMASSRTMIRTYSEQFPESPEMVVKEVNQRILKDTQAGFFLTLFYGLLDPSTGDFRYASAGHSPPFLLANSKAQSLKRTGVPLGIYENATWKAEQASLTPGSALLLYTDGITEAQNAERQFFGESRVLQATSIPKESAESILNSLVSEVQNFVGAEPQGDDQTVLVLLRD
jgi:serine phosphatase RsbU (regulator of sigma subunit)/tetratricopeptide (TPR) repeat protein